MQPVAVFLIYHGMGHFNACFRIAKILEVDHKVYFAGVEFFQKYVTAQGFAYYALKSVPFGMGFENWVNTIHKKKNIYFSSLHDRYHDSLYHHREEELHEMMDRLQPDTVIIDSFQTTDFIVLYPLFKKRPIKIALVHIVLPAILQWNCPPINSLVLPGKNINVNLSVFVSFVGTITKKFFSKVKYLGMDNAFLIRRRIIANKVPAKYVSKKNSFTGLVLQCIEEFILCNREFDFKENIVSPCQHYLGSMIDESRVDICDEKYLKTIVRCKDEFSKKKRAVIYCSFGTVKPQYERLVNSFIKRLVSVAVSQDYILIVTSGGKDLDVRFKFPNVHFFKNVPQLEVLSVADVFITHGGLNSIKESIHEEVPMLVYLVDSYGDQKGNSSRVIFHRLGLRGNLKHDAEDEISNKIRELIHNPAYKQNLKEIKKADTHYTADNFKNLFRQLKPLL